MPRMVYHIVIVMQQVAEARARVSANALGFALLLGLIGLIIIAPIT
ncbi:MAG TPA: hypothetical protein VMI31_08165 [Fimbriimonadaceae bacterium]|nr:hypothetical protein [Fimbriimonadaceae bacterium]